MFYRSNRFVSITMVFVNKALLSGQSSLNAPLFITWYQCAVTAAASYAIASLPMAGSKNLSVQLQISPSVLRKVGLHINEYLINETFYGAIVSPIKLNKTELFLFEGAAAFCSICSDDNI